MNNILNEAIIKLVEKLSDICNESTEEVGANIEVITEHPLSIEFGISGYEDCEKFTLNQIDQLHFHYCCSYSFCDGTTGFENKDILFTSIGDLIMFIRNELFHEDNTIDCIEEEC